MKNGKATLTESGDKLNVLAVISSFAGGPGRILAHIVENAPASVSVDAVSLSDIYEPDILDILNRKASFVCALNKKSGSDYKTYLSFKKKIGGLSPHVAISFDFASNIYTFAVLRRQKTPWVASVYGLKGAFVFWRRWVERVAFVFSGKVVTDSFAVKDKLLRYRIIPSRKIKVISNGTPLQTNGRRVGLGSGSKTIGCVANFYSEIKGHRYAIDAIRYLPANFKLVMIGDGLLKKKMMNHAGNIGVRERIIFLGHKSQVEVLEEMTKMDVLVIPSLSEGFGLTAIEAMSVGLPVVASSVGGLPSVVDDGKTGRLVPPGDSNAIADAIEEILSDNERYIAMQKACVECVKERYSVDKMVEQYIGLLDGLAIRNRLKHRQEQTVTGYN